MCTAKHALLVLSLAMACGGSQKPASAPAAWREVASEHFTVWTNTSPARARTLIKTMENLRQVVLGISFFKKENKGKSFVIAFDTIDEVHQYVEPQFIAKAMGGSAIMQPVIVLAAESLDDNRQIVTHELTHVISFNVIHHQPTWFAEGLAGYFETVRLDEERAKLDVGVPSNGRLRVLHDFEPTPARALFACDRPICEGEVFYATSWAVFTYLLNEHQAALFDYMNQLIETPPDLQAKLWTTVFPDLPPEKLDRELDHWLHKGQIRISKYTIVLKEWPVTERAIGEADVLAAKGLLRYAHAPSGGAPPEITKALALDPTNLLANMIDAYARKSITPELAQTLTAAHPDDWRAWWLAWRAARNATESREAREKTCSLLEASGAGSIDACARDAGGNLAPDPRYQVFMAALPQVTECVKKTKLIEHGATLSIDIDITEAGTVTAARAAMGSAETNACVEDIAKGLAFPPHHAGTFHLSTTRP